MQVMHQKVLTRNCTNTNEILHFINELSIKLQFMYYDQKQLLVFNDPLQKPKIAREPKIANHLIFGSFLHIK